MNSSFANLNSNSRVWVFQSDRFLTENEANHIRKYMDAFMPEWASHGNDLYGGYSVEKNLFLVVGVDESKIPASGCSIDSLTRVVKELGKTLSIDFFNRMAIAYENKAGEIIIVSLPDFKRLIIESKINENTIVFNNLITTKKDFDTNWQTPVKNSWHTNLFQIV